MKPLLFSPLLILLLVGTALAGTAGDQERQTVAAAKTWLALVDAGRYDESWRKASDVFRRAVSQQQWAHSLHAVRQPLGAVLSRVEKTATNATQLPGAPDGHYVVMTFATRFARKQNAVETVTFRQGTDGVWRAVGYFIK